MAKKWGIRRQVLVDELEGTVHRAYGSLPNMSYIVRPGGTIEYRADWTDPRTLSMALDQVSYQREQRRARHRMTPYYLEWAPQRSADGEAFMDSVLEVAGKRAVDEFIRAMGHTMGAAAARPLEQWRSDRMGSS
jgi:hypothetical protein